MRVDKGYNRLVRDVWFVDFGKIYSREGEPSL